MICTIAPFPFPHLSETREKYTFKIQPLFSPIKKRLNLFLNEEDDDDATTNEIMVASWCLTNSILNNRVDGS